MRSMTMHVVMSSAACPKTRFMSARERDKRLALAERGEKLHECHLARTFLLLIWIRVLVVQAVSGEVELAQRQLEQLRDDAC